MARCRRRPLTPGSPTPVLNAKFFEQPVLNSPYEAPGRHWRLDKSGQPTHEIVPSRRAADFVTPVPKPRRAGPGRGAAAGSEQARLVLDEGRGLSTADQQYLKDVIAQVRERVTRWRTVPDPDRWGVTPETARILRHWRSHRFSGVRPFFCQLEAAETVVWLTEVARRSKAGKDLLKYLEDASRDANPDLSRLALKLATGAGKTTVMAMLIAWQAVNAVRHPGSTRFTRGFLVVAPGITIRDRLRVLLPNDPNSYYKSRELLPADMLRDLDRAKIVITNYHAFIRREKMKLSKGGRALLQGRGQGPEIRTKETEGQMLQRVCPELMGMKRVMVFNDEGHHCYREKPPESSEEDAIRREEIQEVNKNKEAARVWLSGLESVQRKLGVLRVVDLSATPFFLRGSGYAEGTLFPWTMSDFSLMDAIECGIVKLPRVPVADNIPGGDSPKFRNLWEHIGKKMPKKGRGKAASPLDPRKLPVELQTALEALYGNYEKVFELWRKAETDVPPAFIVVCNNTSTSKLVFDYVSGFLWPPLDKSAAPGNRQLHNGRLPLFQNFDENGVRLARPRTLLIDSQQLESGEALDPAFRKDAATQIEQFRREIVQRTGDRRQAENLSDADILREVMNTVGKAGRLGADIRCVVSVSMLTEGWDANNVTHVLGVRAFGTQLLCEQVVGRALRRQSYDLNDDGLFNVEYADVLGIPFDFTAEPVVAPPQPPRETVEVRAVVPERNACEIRFPRVQGYRVELPKERLRAEFDDDATLELTPDLVGPTITQNQGIIGKPVDLTLEGLENVRRNTLLYELTWRLLETKYRDAGEDPKLYLFGQLKQITGRWLDDHLVCKGGTFPAQLMYLELADMACERIAQGIGSPSREPQARPPVKAILHPYSPWGSTATVRFTTSKKRRWRTDARQCHVNWAVCDSDWEAEFCRVAEADSRVRAYVKNQGLGLDVPYLHGSESRTYVPDFILKVDDGRGNGDLLNLVVEIKGYRREDAKDKKKTMDAYWIPGVNDLRGFGRWAFAELTDNWTMEEALDAAIAGGDG